MKPALTVSIAKIARLGVLSNNRMGASAARSARIIAALAVCSGRIGKFN